MISKIRWWQPKFDVKLVAVFLVASILVGCASDSSFQKTNDKVSAITVGDPGEVSATSLVKAMIRSGFSRDEILELGPGIRRSLSQSGGAQARRNGEIVALFSHKNGKLYVTSGASGTFVTEM